MTGIYRGSGTSGIGQPIEDLLALKADVDNSTLTGITVIENVIIGDQGTEGTGINIGGTNYESTFKVSDIDGTNYAQNILHRHSTVLEPLIVGARSNSNTISHANVTTGQGLFSILGAGWAGNNYKIFGTISIKADSGTISDTSSPGIVTISATPDGSTTLSEILNITGNKRITGDFSNATITDRVMFQTSTVNGSTNIHSIPNGTGPSASFSVEDNTLLSTGNGAVGQLNLICGSEVRITSGIRGSGTYLPITFYTNGAEKMRIDTSGNFLSTGGGGIGYGAGSGGSVTQLTSKSTAVTLNKPSGQITMNNAALVANTSVPFIFNNTSISIYDTITVNIAGGSAGYSYYTTQVDYIASGLCVISLRNITAGSLSEAVILTFQIHKGSIT